jgi:hypothetical protein
MASNSRYPPSANPVDTTLFRHPAFQRFLLLPGGKEVCGGLSQENALPRELPSGFPHFRVAATGCHHMQNCLRFQELTGTKYG